MKKLQYLILLQPGQTHKVGEEYRLTPKGIATMRGRAETLNNLIAQLNVSIPLDVGAPSAFVLFAPTHSCSQSADIIYETLGIPTHVEYALKRGAPSAAAATTILSHDDHHILLVVCHRREMDAVVPQLLATMPEATMDADTHQGMVLINCVAHAESAK